jgi:hypothetical protein
MALLLACSGENTAPEPPAVLEIWVISRGDDLDLDGYQLVVDGGAPRDVRVSDYVLLDALEPGVHAVELNGVARNCVAAPRDLQVVSLVRGDTVDTRFDVACSETGVLAGIATTGLDQDLSYRILVDDVPHPQPLLAHGTTRVTRVAPGRHTFRLTDLSPNCQATPEQVSTVVGTEELEPIDFAVTCYAATAVLEVTVSSRGTDPAGYQVRIDGTSHDWPRDDGVFYAAGLTPGRHTVSLDVAANCTVDPGPQAVQVVAGRLVRDTVSVGFVVECGDPWQIAFYRDHQSPGGIYLASVGGSTEERLGEGGFALAWAPDGNRIAYNCGVNMCLLELGGATWVVTERFATIGGDWSPDGSRLVFGTYTCPNGWCYYDEVFEGLLVASIDGKTLEKVVLPPEVGWASHVSWSSRGEFVFSCGTQRYNANEICIVRPDGSGFRRLTAIPGASDPVWSPDGTRIAVSWHHHAGAGRYQSDILIVDANWGSVVHVVEDGHDPAWTGDGARILFARLGCSSPCDLGIHAVRSDGTGLVRLTTKPDRWPSARP